MGENKKPENPQAYPMDYSHEGYRMETGMTLRDHFAGLAMQSLILKTTERKLSIWSKVLIFLGRDGWIVDYELSQSKISNSAYDIADAMLKQREL